MKSVTAKVQDGSGAKPPEIWRDLWSKLLQKKCDNKHVNSMLKVHRGREGGGVKNVGEKRDGKGTGGEGS